MYNVFPRGFSFVCPCRLSVVEFAFSWHKKSTTEIKIEHVLVRLMHHEHTKCEINRKPWHTQKMSWGLIKTVKNVSLHCQKEIGNWSYSLWDTCWQTILWDSLHLFTTSKANIYTATDRKWDRKREHIQEPTLPKQQQKAHSQFMCVSIRQMLSHPPTITHMAKLSCC